MSILVKNATIVTMNQNRQIIEDGAIAIQNTEIMDVGKSADLVGKYKFDKVIDAQKNPVLPGFINTHNHFFQTLYKSLLDDLALLDWLPAQYTMSKNLRKEDCFYGALIGSIEHIRTGCTSVLDENYPYAGETTDSVLKACAEVGIRGTIARGHFDRDVWNLGAPFIEDTDNQIKDLISLIDRWKDHDLVRVWSTPNWAPYCSDELITQVCEVAEKYKIGISFHLHEVAEEVQRWKKMTGLSPIQYYFNKGIKLLNSRLVAVHTVWLDDKDIEILAKTGSNASHNPISNMYTAAGISPVPKMIKTGVNVGLGTDGAASNNGQDLIEVIKTTALLHKVAACDPLAITAEKVLEMATIDGARTLGLEKQIGSIEPGKKADIVIFDLKHANTTPINRPHSQIVYCAKSHNVKTVIINGKIVMEDGIITTVDERKVIEETQKTIDNLIERSGVEKLRRGWTK